MLEDRHGASVEDPLKLANYLSPMFLQAGSLCEQHAHIDAFLQNLSQASAPPGTSAPV